MDFFIASCHAQLSELGQGSLQQELGGLLDDTMLQITACQIKALSSPNSRSPLPTSQPASPSCRRALGYGFETVLGILCPGAGAGGWLGAGRGGTDSSPSPSPGGMERKLLKAEVVWVVGSGFMGHSVRGTQRHIDDNGEILYFTGSKPRNLSEGPYDSTRTWKSDGQSHFASTHQCDSKRHTRPRTIGFAFYSLLKSQQRRQDWHGFTFITTKKHRRQSGISPLRCILTLLFPDSIRPQEARSIRMPLAQVAEDMISLCPPATSTRFLGRACFKNKQQLNGTAYGMTQLCSSKVHSATAAPKSGSSCLTNLTTGIAFPRLGAAARMT
ncbi:hypothetical protein PM082_013826 [Marasmius tenuissimus]|nr:hypothetical protein PM082_013826 [Marasmius tenuissimus]